MVFEFPCKVVVVAADSLVDKIIDKVLEAQAKGKNKYGWIKPKKDK